jgi:hypothetical protein
MNGLGTPFSVRLIPQLATCLSLVRHCLVTISIALIGGCGSSQDASENTGSSTPAGPSTPSDAAPDNQWDPEAYQDRTARQLDRIVAELTRGSSEDLATMLDSGFTTTDLRPPVNRAETAYDQNGARVLRWEPDRKTQATRTGVAGLRQALGEVRSPWPPDAADPRVELKQFRIEPRGDEIVSQVSCRVYAPGAETGVQQTTIWACGWEYVPEEDRAPRLRWLRLENLEEVQVDMIGGEPLLVDATESLIGALSCYQQQLRHGANHWITRYPNLKHRFHHGVAIGDVDGDGREDLYVCQPEGLPNLLLQRTPEGAVREGASEAGIDCLDASRSALLVDFDNDGDQDLALLSLEALVVFENVGDVKFERRGYFPRKGRLTSLCAADYDDDGFVDIYLCGYSGPVERGRLSDPVPMHDALNGGENALFKNDGQWGFEDVTPHVGLGKNSTRWSFAASWEDYDNDGDMDLYVANDYGRNSLYRQDRSGGAIVFHDVADGAGVEDMSFGMGVSWGDPNRDGWFDVHISNMYSAAGLRTTYQRNFKKHIVHADDKHIEAVRYLAVGNSLFQNRGDGEFDYISHESGVLRGLWSWSCNFADLNNDGWEDLLVANGFLSGPSQTKDL